MKEQTCSPTQKKWTPVMDKHGLQQWPATMDILYSNIAQQKDATMVGDPKALSVTFHPRVDAT
jgi:hypothetical protein